MTDEKMNLAHFCEIIKEKGAYIGDDWHIHRKNGSLMSRQCSNKYFMTRCRIEGKERNFMEHRVIWCFINGDIPNGLQVNHKDFDRGNNNIDNLELMTAKENINYSLDAGRGNPCRGEKSGKAIFANKDAQAIRWLFNHGWKYGSIAKLYKKGCEHTISRIARKKRYWNVPDADSVFDVYSTIVGKVIENDPKEKIVETAIADMQRKSVELRFMTDRDAIKETVGDILFSLASLGKTEGIDVSEMLLAKR